MEDQKNKQVLNVELDEHVKKASVTGLGSDEKVVMRQELNKEELDQATGGEFKCCQVCYVLCYNEGVSSTVSKLKQ